MLGHGHVYLPSMARDPKENPSRYDVSGNVEAQYLDAAQTVLANKKGIADLEALQVLEEEFLAKAYATLLSEVRTDTPMSCELLRHIHDRIFGEIYEWAGRWRTVQISKAGAVWPPPVYLDQAMGEFERQVLNEYPASSIGDDAGFCASAGEIQGEFLAIHPFREGNARTIKLLTNLLAAQTGRPLLVYDDSDAGRDRYIAAARAAIVRDYRAMAEVIRGALDAARKQPRVPEESSGASPPASAEGPQ